MIYTGETPLGRALRRIAKSKRLSALDVPVLDDSADEIDQLTRELTEARAEIVRLVQQATEMQVALGTLKAEEQTLRTALEQVAQHDGERGEMGHDGTWERKQSPQEIARQALSSSSETDA